MNPDKVAEDNGLIEALIERGHSRDQIAAMTPAEAFDEFCMWHGLIHWGPRLRSVLETLEEAKVG